MGTLMPGAHHVIDHSKPPQRRTGAIGVNAATHVASLNSTEQHYAQLIAARPTGALALIDDPETFDAPAEGQKHFAALGVYAFTRSTFENTGYAGSSISRC